MSVGLAIVALLIFLYGALALKLGRLSITMPMVFVIAGFLLGPGGMNLLQISPWAEGVKSLTEVTLALLLFADASTLDLRQVRNDKSLILRLLGIGMPLTILLGAACLLGLLPGEGLAFAALLGVILAPTDAALGLPIFNEPKVPVRIRRALNVESGLNDGIATPFVMLFIAFATASQTHSHVNWLSYALLEIVIALLVGAVVGIGGGWLLTKAVGRGWAAGTSEQIAVFGLGLTAYFASLMLEGNGFIAAFSGGIIFSAATSNRFAEPTDLLSIEPDPRELAALDDRARLEQQEPRRRRVEDAVGCARDGADRPRGGSALRAGGPSPPVPGPATGLGRIETPMEP